jgi:hypothetical protein
MARPKADDGVVAETVELPIPPPDGYLSLGEAPRDGKAIVLLHRDGSAEEKGYWRNYSRRFDWRVNGWVDNSRWARFNAGGQALTIDPIAWRPTRGFE